MINSDIKKGEIAVGESAAKMVNSKNKTVILSESMVPVVSHKALPKVSNGHSHEVKMNLINSEVQIEKDSKLPIKLQGANNRLTTINKTAKKIKPMHVVHNKEITKGKPSNRSFHSLNYYDQGAPLSIALDQDYRDALLNNFAANVVDYEQMNYFIGVELAELLLFCKLQDPANLNTYFPGYKDGKHWQCSNLRLKTDEPYGSDNLIETNWKGSSNYPALSPLELQPLRCKLVAAYARINSLDFDTAANTLMESFGVDPQNCLESLFNPEQTALKLANHFSIINPLPSSFKKVVSLSKNGAVKSIYVAAQMAGLNYLLPCLNIIRSSDYEHSTFHAMMSSNLSLLNLDKIAKNSHAEIILTSNFLLANRFKDLTEAAITSWYGAQYTYKQIDYIPLEGRKLLYLYDGSDEERALALKLFALFEKKKKITMKVLSKDINNNFINMNKFQFLEHAKEREVYIPENLRKYLKKINTLPTKKIKRRYVIYPIIYEKDLVMIFAPSDTGKTWISLSIGIALATGQDIFGQWKVKRVQKILYVAGEMSNNSMNNRIFDINRVYKRIEDNDNFNFEPVRGVDIASKAGQRDIEDLLEKYPGTEVIIFDNLVTLSKGATYEANWDKIVKWKQTALKNITVKMIHHTTKEGEYRGSSDLKNKSDFMIKIMNHEQFLEYTAKNNRNVTIAKAEAVLEKLYGKVDEKNLTLYIGTEKHRDVSKDKVPFFRAELNINAEDPEWTTTPIDQKEYSKILAGDEDNPDSNAEAKFTKWPISKQRQKIIELIQKEYNIEDMCKELECGKTKLCEIRKNTKTRECDLLEAEGGDDDV